MATNVQRVTAVLKGLQAFALNHRPGVEPEAMTAEEQAGWWWRRFMGWICGSCRRRRGWSCGRSN